MPRSNSITAVDTRRLLVERVASSPYLRKSARLHALFLYLCDRVLDGSEEIREHEVGHKVFGRPPAYDTTADNIVRVHASMLRKRLEQYFANEGRDEPIIIDIPKGNYAPVFHERPFIPVPIPTSPRRSGVLDWRTWLFIGLAAIFACSTVFVLLRSRSLVRPQPTILLGKPTVRQFWSQIFRRDQTTDIVLDDAGLGFYQEVTERRIGLSEYFDRSYLRKMEDRAVTTKPDRQLAASMVLKRHSNYGSATLLWKFAQTADVLHGPVVLHFARDYTFREAKVNNVILLGNSGSNPWIEPFESRLAIRWKYNDSLGAYYPVDTSAGLTTAEKFRITTPGIEPREGYALIALVPNLSGTGRVMIISGSGGAAMGAAADFLSEEQSVSQLRSLLPKTKDSQFPNFETLLKVNTRSGLPRDASVVICRALQ